VNSPKKKSQTPVEDVGLKFPLRGGRVRIVGANFGASSSTVQVYVGDTQATGASWMDDERVVCDVAAGVGTGLEIRVHVAMQVMQCVVVCCSVFKCVAVCRSVVQCGAVCCSVVPCSAVWCSVVQCVAVCCSVL